MNYGGGKKNEDIQNGVITERNKLIRKQLLQLLKVMILICIENI